MEHRGDAPSARFVHARVLSRRTADAVLLLALDGPTAEPVALHGTGVAIWDLLAQPRSIAEVTDALHASFETGSDEISHSVGTYVEQLRSARLVEPAA